MHIPIVIRQEARSAAKRSYVLLFVISFMFLRQIYAFPVKLVRFPQIFFNFFGVGFFRWGGGVGRPLGFCFVGGGGGGGIGGGHPLPLSR